MQTFDDLREFIAFLEWKDPLVRVTRQVDPILEINAVADRLARKEGPAVLFQNVKGSAVPVLGNLFGSHRRVAWALGSEIVDRNMAREGASLYLMIVSIKKERPHQGREIIEKIWKQKGQAEFIANVIVVDHDIDVHNLSEVMWAFPLNVRADQDLVISDRREQDLEHPGLSPRGEGARLGMDATRKWKEENYTRPRPDVVAMDEEVTGRVMEHWERDGLP